MIAIAGGKGGCGKTTTALGIARVIGERERVTVVDADVDMPDLHVVAGTPAAPGIDALAGGASTGRCRHRAVAEPGVSIVPAGHDGDTLDSAFERLGRVDHRVIVDTPAGASIDVIRPIRAADRVVLVSTPTRESLVDTAKTAAIARSIGTPIVGLVVNRSDGSIDPTSLVGCNVITHVPTVAHGSPRTVARASYVEIVASLNERNV